MSLLSKPLFRRIIQTISYTDQFEYPLTVFQVWQRLLQKKMSYQNIKDAIQELVVSKTLEKDGDFVFLAGRKKIVQERLVAEQRAAAMKESERELLSVVARIPWIQGVAVTGSVSMGVAAEKDDLDLMIITKSRLLWLSRIVLVLVASLYGRRRFWWEDREWRVKPKKKESLVQQKTKWCLNLWLTTDSLSVPKNKQSLYTAYEVCQALFIYDRAAVENQFLFKNKWAKKYLPHYYVWRCNSLGTKRFAKEKLIFLLLQPFFISVDVVLFISQRMYMQMHMTTEKVARSFAYFHPRPTSTLINNGWKKSLRAVVIKSVQQERKQLPAFLLPEEVQKVLEEAKKRKEKIVLVTGVFDMLHVAHRQFLVQARMTGDVLVVGLESDSRVRALKGEGRPINDQKKRLKQMENLGVADAVFILPEDFSTEEQRLELVKLVSPNVLAVSAHSPFIENKEKIMKKVGGKVQVVMDQDRAVSTTKLLKQLGKV